MLCVKQKALSHLSSLVWSSPCTHFSLPPTEFKLQQLVKEFEERERLQVNNLSSCSSVKSPQLWATFTPWSTALRRGGSKWLCRVNQIPSSCVSGQRLSYNSSDLLGIFEMWLNELKVTWLRDRLAERAHIIQFLTYDTDVITLLSCSTLV